MHVECAVSVEHSHTTQFVRMNYIARRVAVDTYGNGGCKYWYVVRLNSANIRESSVIE